MTQASAAHLRDVQGADDRCARALGAVLDALAHTRTETTTDGVIAAAPRQLCASGVFDRVMLSSVRGSLWSPQVLYCRGLDGQVSLEIDAFLEGADIPLSSPLVEAEVVRRRLPALVNDALGEPRAYAPLVRRMNCRDYVVAPLVAMSTVVGLLHADRMVGAPPVAAMDRDLLRLFAEGVGVAYERAVLSQRSEQQRHAVAEVCADAIRALTDPAETPSLAADFPLAVATKRAAPQPMCGGDVRESGRMSRLTGREREVLALLASGATNSQLADRLTVAESTVKSHVKHILHKLAVGNRAAAIACYLRETRYDERWSR
ncbi:LuxR C-terminal-related transcriptional regulator [Mycobacterium sp. CVI_P3]|uniref:LuxR C-terminal-related transcriptional regulator n=1 Tax=Mycobacterium pinniadriaticum TaxID=2994102 RepID=A0ABT3SIR2_9MYCO|nr:LuxR family transcriptional regulator [Mycobacterium pinniadriaticum]MCX2932388.1 LuxR C-terminal-related transcriptional regulator [Mycobacterium pinniadriaticum]MCX2938755.1 LuxR C-terminal-related transcriptional regulator [Mycobacterium pinniadriaticum]